MLPEKGSGEDVDVPGLVEWLDPVVTMIMSDTEGDTTSEDEERPHARRRKPKPALKIVLLLREISSYQFLVQCVNRSASKVTSSRIRRESCRGTKAYHSRVIYEATAMPPRFARWAASRGFLCYSGS